MLIEAIFQAYRKAWYFDPCTDLVWTIEDGQIYADCFAVLYWAEHGVLPPPSLETAQIIAQTSILQDFAVEQGYDVVLALYQGWHGRNDWGYLPVQYWELGRKLAIALGAVNPDAPWQVPDWPERVRALRELEAQYEMA